MGNFFYKHCARSAQSMHNRVESVRFAEQMKVAREVRQEIMRYSWVTNLFRGEYQSQILYKEIIQDSECPMWWRPGDLYYLTVNQREQIRTAMSVWPMVWRPGAILEYLFKRFYVAYATRGVQLLASPHASSLHLYLDYSLFLGIYYIMLKTPHFVCLVHPLTGLMKGVLPIVLETMGYVASNPTNEGILSPAHELIVNTFTEPELFDPLQLGVRDEKVKEKKIRTAAIFICVMIMGTLLNGFATTEQVLY